MSPVEALRLALVKEHEAHDLYQRLAQEQPVARERLDYFFLASFLGR